MIIYLDLDGVCCDFHSAAIRANGCNPEVILPNWPKGEYGICGVLGVPEETFWHEIGNWGSRFWSDLEEYPWFQDLYNALQEYGDVIFLTSPSWDAYSLLGKKRWFESRFGRAFRDFVVTNRKPLLSRPGSVLIDDSPSQVADFAAGPGGYAILFPQPWNDAPEPEDRVCYVTQALDRILLRRSDA